MEPASKLLLVDGHAYAYRSFFAIRSLSSPHGSPTNAIYGFVHTLRRLRAEFSPSHLSVVWDGGLAAERMALLPDYKAQRPPMPASLAQQIEELGGWLEASGLASVCREGIEADDAIATLTRLARANGLEVLIASSDKDFMQLVAPGVGLINPGDKSGQVWGAEQVRAKAGVEPAQIVDWLSLVGDTVDNIPGVPGVGAKGAARLLEQFGSWDELAARLDEVPSERLRAALGAARGTVERNQLMVSLKDDLDLGLAVADLEPKSPDLPRLHTLYTRWGFQSLRRGVEPAAALAAQPVLL